MKKRKYSILIDSILPGFVEMSVLILVFTIAITLLVLCIVAAMHLVVVISTYLGIYEPGN